MSDLLKRSGLQLDSFRDLKHLEHFFRDFFVRPIDYNSPLFVKVDVQEDEKSFIVHADLPGVEKDAIEVQVDGDLVSICAKANEEYKEKEGSKVVRSERHVGQYFRSFQLGCEVDENAATASYKNGVLELILPKRGEGPTRKKLTIS
mgnify:CR=1 FL=1